VIDLAKLRERSLPARPVSLAKSADAAAAAENSPPPAHWQTAMPRQVMAMLFADVKDFSKLREENSPRFFLRFLHQVDDVLRSLAQPPTFSNTWGDGLYMVFHQAADCAEAALSLLERAAQMDCRDLGLGETTPVRIGVHAGPVFGGVDPIIGKKSYLGSHVTRAARIEPVTIPGCAYASEQFAALLAVQPRQDFVCEYIGIEPLAKQYDRCPLYRLARS
jgi:class 3 adenylate cyclase